MAKELLFGSDGLTLAIMLMVLMLAFSFDLVSGRRKARGRKLVKELASNLAMAFVATAIVGFVAVLTSAESAVPTPLLVGKVTDSNGRPAPGVAVLLISQRQGDLLGEYSFQTHGGDETSAGGNYFIPLTNVPVGDYEVALRDSEDWLLRLVQVKPVSIKWPRYGSIEGPDFIVDNDR